MYNPPDVRWDVLNDIMSQHYLHIQRIFGLKGLQQYTVRRHNESIAAKSGLIRALRVAVPQSSSRCPT